MNIEVRNQNSERTRKGHSTRPLRTSSVERPKAEKKEYNRYKKSARKVLVGAGISTGIVIAALFGNHINNQNMINNATNFGIDKQDAKDFDKYCDKVEKKINSKFGSKESRIINTQIENRLAYMFNNSNGRLTNEQLNSFIQQCVDAILNNRRTDKSEGAIYLVNKDGLSVDASSAADFENLVNNILDSSINK